MSYKIRNLDRFVDATHQTYYPNILVSGCSFVYNNSEQHMCTWPYYLRDLTNAMQIYDCSQSGAGNDHTFRSVINVLENNPKLTPDNTLVIVMWTMMHRSDVIATQNITKHFHEMSNYFFNDQFATLSLFSDADSGTVVDDLCRLFNIVIDSDARAYQNLLNVIALKNYLENRKFKFVFTHHNDPKYELTRIDSPLVKTFIDSVETMRYLGEYTTTTNQTIPGDGHPTPDAHLSWTQDYLIPYLCENNLCYKLY